MKKIKGVESAEFNLVNSQLKIVGNRQMSRQAIVQAVEKLGHKVEEEEKTKGNTGLTVVLALNYGARQEILDSVKKIADAAVRGKVNIEDFDIDEFSEYLYTAGLPDPDLLIRPSGELRISNFLLWQLSYAELYFTKKFWPDFKRRDIEEAIADYQKRERRFGGIDAVKKDN